LRKPVRSVRRRPREHGHEADSDPSDGAEAKFDMSKWLFGAIGLQTAIILGPVVALGR
jgi:hypothetical protein